MKCFLMRSIPFTAAVMLAAGCGGELKHNSSPKDDKAVAQDDKDKKAEPADDHSGWWCPEHGLPEEVCDLCSRKYRDAEKAKGNWCEHNRVKTSCFKCNPGLQAKYAAEYKSKFGKEPPPVEEEESGKK